MNSQVASSSTYSAVAAGENFTCALTSAGGVKCWGDNWGGRLGDGTTRGRSTPVQVVGLSSGIQSVTAGYEHACALTSAGGVKCWGYNADGQLGNGSSSSSSTPVDVSGLQSGVTAIAAGGAHTCALTSAGGVKCWGYNQYGQVGDSSNSSRSSPVDVTGLTSGVAKIAAGYEHTCALTSAGGVKCWGHSLATSSNINRNQPIDVNGLTSGVQSLAAGYAHTCALTTGGGLKCWGDNDYGQLGDDSTNQSYTPVNVTGLSSGVSAISTGGFTACALTSAGGVKCWGRNASGQVGDGTTVERHTPVDAGGLASGIAAVAVGVHHSCAISSTGALKCWGSNASGQCGDGIALWHSMPMDVSDLSNGNFAIYSGYAHTCVVNSGSGAKCWGDNTSGQLGDGTTTSKSSPVEVSGLTSNISILAPGMNHTCALTSTGGAKCWGGNDSGQLGDNTTTQRLSPVSVSGMTNGISQISAGNGHTCALTSGGDVKCWGSNNQGQVGDGTYDNRTTPVQVSGLSSGIDAISTGGVHSCALTSTGGVKCWGDNSYGQLGDGSDIDRPTPVDVTGLTSGVIAISTGVYHTCALTSTGGVKCWGANWAGQLGDGTTGNHNLPVNVVGLASGVESITAGGNHSCALTTYGGAKCWGYNGYGQLGNGSVADLYTPVDVVGLSGGGIMLTAGNNHTCALVSGGRAKCWGWDLDGQLGMGIITKNLIPVDILDNLPTRLKLNYPDGESGSFFTLTGENYPANSTTALSVNGFILVDSLMTTDTGGFIVFLHTSSADKGLYQLNASLHPEVSAIFRLEINQSLRIQEGGGQVLEIPARIAINQELFIPLISRNY